METAELANQLAATDIAVDPDGWALAAYRLAVARSELAADRSSLVECLELLDKAGRVLSVERAPLEHGRILTATGNCHRSIGRPDLAAAAFERAVIALDGRAGEAERAAALANLGLARTEAGDTAGAVEALDQAIALLTSSRDGSAASGDAEPAANHLDDDTRRTLGAALVNRAQTHQSSATDDGLDAAQADYRRALTILAAESPQAAMAWHGLASALLEQARRLSPSSERASRTEEAMIALEQALAVFSVNAFPFQHAIVRHSMAVAHRLRADSAEGSEHDTTWAAHHAELAIGLFDPRLHRAQWQTVSELITDLEQRLAPRSRVAAAVDLLNAVDEPDRVRILRERLSPLADVPEVRVAADLARLCRALGAVDGPTYQTVVETLITVLMELPDRLLAAGCEALVAANMTHGDPVARNKRLDDAIQARLFGPQRVRVRDLLVANGWERP